jgi:hypothetical protein
MPSLGVAPLRPEEAITIWPARAEVRQQGNWIRISSQKPLPSSSCIRPLPPRKLHSRQPSNLDSRPWPLYNICPDVNALTCLCSGDCCQAGISRPPPGSPSGLESQNIPGLQRGKREACRDNHWRLASFALAPKRRRRGGTARASVRTSGPLDRVRGVRRVPLLPRVRRMRF